MDAVLGAHLSTELAGPQNVRCTFQTRPSCLQARCPLTVDKSQGRTSPKVVWGHSRGPPAEVDGDLSSQWTFTCPGETGGLLTRPVLGRAAPAPVGKGDGPRGEEAILSHKEFSGSLCPLPGRQGRGLEPR